MARVARELTITPIHPHLGARVEGVDLEEAIDEPTFRRIFDAFQEHSVLVFGDQRLSDERQMAFSRRFGTLETTIKSVGQERRLHENLVDLSNLDPDGNDKLMDWSDRRMLKVGNQLWHTDISLTPCRPWLAALRREVPLRRRDGVVSMPHAYATSGRSARIDGGYVSQHLPPAERSPRVLTRARAVCSGRQRWSRLTRECRRRSHRSHPVHRGMAYD